MFVLIRFLGILLQSQNRLYNATRLPWYINIIYSLGELSTEFLISTLISFGGRRHQIALLIWTKQSLSTESDISQSNRQLLKTNECISDKVAGCERGMA